MAEQTQTGPIEPQPENQLSPNQEEAQLAETAAGDEVKQEEQGNHAGEEQAEEEKPERKETLPDQPPQQLPQIQGSSQLTRDQIAYGCTFFSNAHGFSNPLNVITPQAMQIRFQPVQKMSAHAAE